MDSLSKINKEVRNCKKCSLYKKAENPVPGEGPKNAKLFFIGVAPGKQEDLTGKPFVGRAGKFLDKLLKQNKIERKKIFITSVVKHFPPENRAPKSNEIKACLPYLQRQIKIINPKLIILLGNIATKSILNKKLKPGTFTKINNRKYFITYHPAAGMRFPKIKTTMKKNFKTLKKLLNYM